MPLPWKKSRVSRISRLMEDFQSLNHKPSKNKKKKQQKQCLIEEEELVVSDPIPMSNSRDLEFSLKPSYVEEKIQRPENFKVQRKSPKRSTLMSENKKTPDLFHQTNVEECVPDVDGKSNCIEVKEKCVLMAVLKIFVVVVLALSTRKLAVGITISVFALIVLDYIRRCILCFLKSCWNAWQALGALFRRGFSFFRAMKGLLIPKRVQNCQNRKEFIIQGADEEEEDACDLVWLPHDIHVLESKLDKAVPERAKEIRRMEVNFNFHRCDGKRWRNLDTDTMLRNLELEENKNGVPMPVCYKEPIRNVETRTKILKKLVPIKLRVGKKGKNCKERHERDSAFSSEVPISWGEDKTGGFQLIDEQENGDKMHSQDTGRVLLAQLLQKADEVEEANQRKGKASDHGIITSSRGLQAKEELDNVEERLETERKAGSGYIFLCFIALAGLVGGRIMALVLAVVACSLLKLLTR